MPRRFSRSSTGRDPTSFLGPTGRSTPTSFVWAARNSASSHTTARSLACQSADACRSCARQSSAVRFLTHEPFMWPTSRPPRRQPARGKRDSQGPRSLADGSLRRRGAPWLPDPTSECPPLSFLGMHGTPGSPNGTPRRSRSLADGVLRNDGAPSPTEPTRDCAPLAFLGMYGAPDSPSNAERSTFRISRPTRATTILRQTAPCGGGQAITGYRATLVTPMLSDGALVGPIAMMRREAWPFTARGSLYAASPSRIRSDTAIPLSVVPRTRGDVPARSRCGIGQELGLPHPSVQTALAEQCLVGGQADRAAALENQDTTSPPER